MEWSIHECPHCHYSGRLHAFAHEDLEYSPCAPHKLDLPSKEQIEAIRKMLADRKDLYSGRFLYRTERFALAEKCLQLRKANAETMLHISLMCAWMHDDNGEDALASEYRKKALKACRTTLKHGISNQTQRIRRRTLQWVIIGKIGESEEAMRGLSTLLAEAKRTVSIRSKSMPPKPEYFDENYRDGFREIPEDLFDDYKDDNRSEHAPPPLDSRTKAKRRNMWTAWLALREFQEAVSAIEYRMIWIRCRTSDLTGALAIARKTGFDGRYAFLAMHRSTNDPKVIDAIKALFATPLHKPLRPDENEDRESRERKKEDRSRLFDVLYDDGRISYTSNTLYKYVCNTVEREDLDYVSISSPDKHEPDNRYKDIPTADIVRELPQEWINVQKEKPRRYYKFPRHELAELARRSDKHAITALTADFKLHLASCARWAGVLVDDWFPELPPNYDFEYPYPWEHPYRTLEDYWPVYKTLARDAAMP